MHNDQFWLLYRLAYTFFRRLLTYFLIYRILRKLIQLTFWLERIRQMLFLVLFLIFLVICDLMRTRAIHKELVSLKNNELKDIRDSVKRIEDTLCIIKKEAVDDVTNMQ